MIYFNVWDLTKIYERKSHTHQYDMKGKEPNPT